MPEWVRDRVLSSIRAIRRNRCDEAAWSDLGHAIWPIVVSTARQLDFRQDPKHVLQEVLVKIFRLSRLPHFETTALARTYIRTVVRSVMSDHHRESAKNRDLHVETHDAAPGPEDLVIARELVDGFSGFLSSDELELAIALLTPGKSKDDTAAELGLTVGNLSVRSCRLRAKLAALIAREWGEKPGTP